MLARIARLVLAGLIFVPWAVLAKAELALYGLMEYVAPDGADD